MDGTLLNNRSKVSPATTAAVRRANDAGKYFTVVSGRSLVAIRQFAPDLPLKQPFGIYNGAMIVDLDGKVYYEQPLEKEDARLVLKLARERNTQVFVWIGQEMYGNVWDEVLTNYAKLSGITPRLFEDEEEVLDHPIAKILWYDTAANIADWLKEFAQSMAGRMNVSTSAPEFIEFNHVDVSKGWCLKRIGELLGVPREQIIAAGDETNDLPMLEYAGLGIAMKNSTPAVLEAADVVSAWTNEEDGLAKLIDQYLLGGSADRNNN